jgi:hypothetical protein
VYIAVRYKNKSNLSFTYRITIDYRSALSDCIELVTLRRSDIEKGMGADSFAVPGVVG